jgi:hypothetical protein
MESHDSTANDLIAGLSKAVHTAYSLAFEMIIHLHCHIFFQEKLLLISVGIHARIVHSAMISLHLCTPTATPFTSLGS